MDKKVRVAGIQNSRVLGDKDTNVPRGLEWVRRAADRGAQVIALPELSNTGFFPQHVDDSYFDLAEEIPGPTTERFANLAVQLGCYIIVPVFEVDAIHRVYYNSAALLGPAGVIGRYRKVHIPAWSRGVEKYYFAPGNLGYPVFELPFCRIGITICYDRHFPECYRHLALNGAQIVFSVNNTASQRSHHVWEAEMIATTSSNGIFLIQINAAGHEGESVFHGNSAIVSPRGEFIRRVEDGEHVLDAELDLHDLELARRQFSSVRDVVWRDFGLDGTQASHLLGDGSWGRPSVRNTHPRGDQTGEAAAPTVSRIR
ncbi:MAG: carbon-nitrogen hydrolase family protein [Chloroflexi bacterium]|nr:carbon-nitrogen hydrolase family protein [Chloroflexota bacterium]